MCESRYSWRRPTAGSTRKLRSGGGGNKNTAQTNRLMVALKVAGSVACTPEKKHEERQPMH